MCAGFGFDYDNDGIMSWEDNYFGCAVTEDILGNDRDRIVYDSCFDDIYLGDEDRKAS